MNKNLTILKNLSYPLLINQFIKRKLSKIKVLSKLHSSNHHSINKKKLFIRNSINKILVLNKNLLIPLKLKKASVKNKKYVTKKKYQNRQFILANKRRNLVLVTSFPIMDSVAEKFIIFVESSFLINYIKFL